AASSFVSPKTSAPQPGRVQDPHLPPGCSPTNKGPASRSAARSAAGAGAAQQPGKRRGAPRPHCHASQHGKESGSCPRGRSCSSSHGCCPSGSSVHTGRRCRTRQPCRRRMSWAGRAQRRRCLCQLSRTCCACTGRKCPGSSSSHRR
ncbi:hypothetical protein M959_07331, partial [Chaetura pelagica]